MGAIHQILLAYGNPAGGGGGTFDPTTIQGTNCRLWLPPHSLSLADNDPVGSFPNLGSGGLTFTQTGSARPTFKAALLNGYAGIRYDGSDDQLQGNGASHYISAGAYTYCVIVKPANTGGTNTGSNAWNNPQIVGDGSGWQGIVVTNSQFHGYIFSDGDAGGAGSAYTPGTWYIVIVKWNGTDLSIRVNGGSAITDPATNPDNLANGLNTGDGGGPPFNGDMLDVVAWNIALTSGEEDTVFAGFNGQYLIY